MKKCGVWWDFPENKPSDGDRVLIHRKKDLATNGKPLHIMVTMSVGTI